jgi:DHA1 family bicyclomycin/chloramphenicol resistance-like MFS transporter
MRPTPRRLHPAVFIALIAGAVSYGAAAMDVYLASMPSMAKALETDAAHIQLTMGVFTVGYAVSQLVYGPLSDRFGRRPVLIGGTLVFVLASFAAALSTTIETLIAFRVIQAFGACSGPVVGRAIVRDRYGRDAAHIFAYISMAMMAMPILAPIIGGWLEIVFGWRANFHFMTGFGFVALIAILALLDESLEQPNRDALHPARLIGNYARLFVHSTFMGYALTIMGAFGGVMAFITASPFVLIELAGVDPRTYGVMFALTAAGFATGSFISARTSRKWGIVRSVRYGTSLNVVFSVLMVAPVLASVFDAWAICIAMILISMSNGLIFANCQAGAIAPFPRMAGTAAALMGAMMMGGSFVVAAVIAGAYDGTAKPMTLAILVCGALTWVAFRALIGRGSPAAKPESVPAAPGR